MASQPKDPRKLNLDAPLLSTRRATGSTNHPRAASWDTRNRVPFSWELSAGKPKDMEKVNTEDFDQIPPPQLPPGRKLFNGDDGFSDDMDTFSLSEAIDMVESAELAKQSNMIGGVSLDSGGNGNQSPSFIIQRFLSDAKALAMSSGLPIPNNINQNDRCYNPQMIDSSPKGCGLGFDGLFTWRTKNKPPCGVKSPVRVTSASVKSQWGWKPKSRPNPKVK